MKIRAAPMKTAHHNDCRCDGCTRLLFYPELPPLDPPPLDSRSTDWLLWCGYVGPLIEGKATLIRRGFLTDGASIPRPVWPVVGHPFQVPLLAYALPHDGEYAAELHPRDVCDRRMLIGMVDSVNRVKRNVIYSSVRGGGGIPWARHTPEGIAFARTFCRSIGEEEYYALRKIGHDWLSGVDAAPRI